MVNGKLLGVKFALPGKNCYPSFFHLLHAIAAEIAVLLGKRQRSPLLLCALMVCTSILVRAQSSNQAGTSKDKSSPVQVNPGKAKTAPPPAAVMDAVRPSSKIKLTGFTNLGVKRAFFLREDEATKVSQSISLTIDEEMAGLKLIDIMPVTRSVRVLHEGVEKDLTFDTDGVASVIAVAAPAAPPGAQQAPSAATASTNPRTPSVPRRTNRAADSSISPRENGRPTSSRSDRPTSQNRRDGRFPPGAGQPRDNR